MSDKLILADLYKDDSILILSQADQLNQILNAEPNPKWIKVHPHVKGHQYLPIDKVEYLLRKIFKRYRIEVLSTCLLLNTICVTVRVHYFDPVTQTWEYHDGVGASELQTEAKSGYLKLDMSNINRGAVTMALPIAKSLAVKDACDHFGKVFGSDLNRKDTVSYIADEKLKIKANGKTPPTML
jgi:hypothetical protein